jgi:uncharacterized membrane protein YraQ (UPF0718 family)
VENTVRDFILLFTSILYEALPFLALGAIISGILEEFIPQRYILRLIPSNRELAIAAGALLGLPFPMCECGILIIMRRLIRKGVPLSVGVSYMLAGPIINGVVMLSTFLAFSGMEQTRNPKGELTHQIGGLGMLSLRMGLGFLVAFVTGMIVEWQHRLHGDRLLAPSLVADMKKGQIIEDDETPRERPGIFARISNAAEAALHDFIPVTVLLIFGALLAALARQVLPHETVEEFSRTHPLEAIVAMMALAVALCLCSEADAFVAASFVGLRPSSKIAFLVLGPMLDFKLYMMYLRVFSPRLIWTIICSVVVQVLLYALMVHFVWENYGPYLTGLAPR